MNADDGPPPDAYGRVTNPERFAPLHQAATDLLDRLILTYDVSRADGDAVDGELPSDVPLVRPAVRLTPRRADAAVLVIGFSAFPGILLRAGPAHRAAFPTCGCDACQETAAEEIVRMRAMVDEVTAGRLRGNWVVDRADGAERDFARWPLRPRGA